MLFRSQSVCDRCKCGHRRRFIIVGGPSHIDYPRLSVNFRSNLKQDYVVLIAKSHLVTCLEVSLVVPRLRQGQLHSPCTATSLSIDSRSCYSVSLLWPMAERHRASKCWHFLLPYGSHRQTLTAQSVFVSSRSTSARLGRLPTRQPAACAMAIPRS